MLEMDDGLTEWDCLEAANSWRCCMMGAKLECPDVTSASPSATWLFPYQEFDSQAIIHLRLQSQICHKSLAQPFTNKCTNKDCSKNSTGFSDPVATWQPIRRPGIWWMYHISQSEDELFSGWQSTNQDWFIYSLNYLIWTEYLEHSNVKHLQAWKRKTDSRR
jgi:hypothetical protein